MKVVNWNARYRRHLAQMEMAAHFVARDSTEDYRTGQPESFALGMAAAMFNHHAKWVNALAADWYIVLDGQDYPYAWGSELSKTWEYWKRAQHAANLNKTTARLYMPGGPFDGLYATCKPHS